MTMLTTMTPPYEHATPEQREAVADWLRAHRVPPENTPIGASFELDEKTGEWRIEQHAKRNGKSFLGPDGEVAKVVVRRAFKAMPPWLDAEHG